jgi:hypothetical protein
MQRQAYYLYVPEYERLYTLPLESFHLAKKLARKLTKRGYHGSVCGFKEQFDGNSWRPMIENPEDVSMPWTF